MRVPRLPLLGALIVLMVTWGGVTRMGSSDPYLSLLVSQAILEEGTIRLDAYRDRAEPPLESYGTTGDVLVWGDRLYYYFPLGSSLFLVPAVAAANLVGLDMARPLDDLLLQRWLSPLFSVAAFLLLYGIGGLYVSRRAAWVIALLTVLGSSLSSTVSTALWNINWVVLFECVVLWLLARWERGRSPTAHPLLIGFLLWACFLSRPSTAPFIAVVMLYLLVRDRAAFARSATVAGGLLGLWVIWNSTEYGAWLPPYYNAGGRVAVHSTRLTPWMALYAHAFSPSRGLFTFSPMLLTVLVGCVAFGRRLARHPLFWLCVGWVLLHIAVISNTTRWWGGHAYGPRLLAETIPAWAVLTFLLWREVRQRPRRLRQLFVGSYLSLAALALVIHSVQGLYNIHTVWWNGTVPPNIDLRPAYLLDWRYPQFAASPSLLCARERDFLDTQWAAQPLELEPRPLPESVRFDDPPERARYVGWGLPEGEWRWSQCREVSILFRPADVPPGPYRITLVASGLGTQRVQATLNGEPLGEVVLDTQIADAVTVTFPASAPLLPDSPNRLTLTLPDSHIPLANFLVRREQRRLGIALRELRVEAVGPQ